MKETKRIKCFLLIVFITNKENPTNKCQVTQIMLSLTARHRAVLYAVYANYLSKAILKNTS